MVKGFILKCSECFKKLQKYGKNLKSFYYYQVLTQMYPSSPLPSLPLSLLERKQNVLYSEDPQISL